MWPDRVSNPGPLALVSDALPTAPRGPATRFAKDLSLMRCQRQYRHVALIQRQSNANVVILEQH